MSEVDDIGCAPYIFMPDASSHAVGAGNDEDGSGAGDEGSDASQLKGGGDGLALALLAFLTMVVRCQET